MIVVDSSGWLEYFANSPNAGFFSAAIENPPELMVPTIVILEVFKKVLRDRGEADALEVVGLMRQGTVSDLDESLAVEAAQLGLVHKLPLADSVILATARRFNATLWTQDVDFKGLPGVRYFPKKT